MGSKYNIILTKEELKRITVNKDVIMVDVHGMKVKEAKHLLKNLIALEQNAFTLDVIHGYNGGNAIKNMLQRDFLSNRITNMENMLYNEGETLLSIKAA